MFFYNRKKIMLMEPRSKQDACCIPATVAIQATGDTYSPSLSPIPSVLPLSHDKKPRCDRPPRRPRSQSLLVTIANPYRPVRSPPHRQPATPSFGEGASGSCSRSGGWSRDDNAGLSGEAELLGPPRCPVARRSRRHPRLRRRLHRRAPPRRRRFA